MYPYQRTLMGNPYISPIYWLFMGKLSPRIPREHQLNPGYTTKNLSFERVVYLVKGENPGSVRIRGPVMLPSLIGFKKCQYKDPKQPVQWNVATSKFPHLH